MQPRTTQSVIDELLLATYGPHPDERKQYMFLQALHGLVRLAKTERMLEIRRSIELASGGLEAACRARRLRQSFQQEEDLAERGGERDDPASQG
jgi:hypothetical protein